MSDNILTALRVRPLNTNETTDKCRVIVDIEEKQYDGSLVIVDPIFFETNGVNRRPYEQQFNLDYSFWSVASQKNSTSQEELFIKCGEPLMQSCLDGLNCSIIAHGQTGSGKVREVLMISKEHYISTHYLSVLFPIPCPMSFVSHEDLHHGGN